MNPSEFIPRDKHDLERVDVLIAAGPSAAIPVLAQLLTCLQDINWPIAAPIANYLTTVGEPLLPHLRNALTSHDDMWIYWILKCVIARLPVQHICSLRTEITNIAETAENDHVAFCIGRAAGFWEDSVVSIMLANRIRAHESFLMELKKMQKEMFGHER